MEQNKKNKEIDKKSAPTFNNDQLGENAAESRGDNYSNKGTNAKEKRR